MKKDRFLLAILAGILLLIVIAIVVFFTRADQVVYVDGTEPADIVHNYVVAIQKGDYEKAYGYVGVMDHKPTFDEFTRKFTEYQPGVGLVGVELGDERIIGLRATVEINILENEFTPFSSGYRSSTQAGLQRQNGEWKLTVMPYQFWDWNWGQK